jgi:hypothetical protein
MLFSNFFANYCIVWSNVIMKDKLTKINDFAGLNGLNILPRVSNTVSNQSFQSLQFLGASDSTVSEDAGIEPRTVETSG